MTAARPTATTIETMKKKRNRKVTIGLGTLLALLILIGATVSVYFWQIRLQKPGEINMANHMNHSDSASAMHVGH